MNKPTPVALLPLVLFLTLFVGSGLWYQSQGVDFAFYQIQAPVAILPALVLAILLGRGVLNARIETFMKGVGDQNHGYERGRRSNHYHHGFDLSFSGCVCQRSESHWRC